MEQTVRHEIFGGMTYADLPSADDSLQNPGSHWVVECTGRKMDPSSPSLVRSSKLIGRS